MKEELKLYIKNNLIIKNKLTSRKKLFNTARSKTINNTNDNCLLDEETALGDSSYTQSSLPNIDLKEWLREKDKYNDFQTTLFKMIDEKKLTDSDVYNKVHIDRRLFSKIRTDKNYHPSKETIILLGLSLELNEKEIEKLLESASYSLPKNNHYDLIIRFCFIKGIYKITDVNNLLDEYNCKLFNY